MKKHEFATPVSMAGVTWERYQTDLRDKLLALGYREQPWHERVLDNEGYLLVTNFRSKSHEIGFSREHQNDPPSKRVRGRTHLPTYNPELFLALAAMTTGEDWIVGEWVEVYDCEYNRINNKSSIGHIFEVNNLGGANSEIGFAGNGCKHIYRKATAQQLIEHFNQNNTTMKKRNYWSSCDDNKKQFGKSDLRSGMTVEDDDGNVMRVFSDTPSGDIAASDRFWTNLDNYNEDLTHKFSTLNITKVWGAPKCEINYLSIDQKGKLLFERKDVPVYTMSRVIEAAKKELGDNFIIEG